MHHLSFFLPILPPVKLTITGRCVKHRERGEGVTRVHAGGNYKGGTWVGHKERGDSYRGENRE